MLNKKEKLFVETVQKARMYVKGELELDYEDGNWYVLDYREYLECAVPIETEPFDKPIITDVEAKKKGINIIKCCETFGFYYVGK